MDRGRSWNVQRAPRSMLIVDLTTGKLLTILRAFPRSEPTKKRFVTEMISWSSKVGDHPFGDPELHHVAGSIFAEGITIHLSHLCPLPSWLILGIQSANPTMQSVTWPLAQKTPPNSSPNANTNGIRKTIPTPPPCTPPAPSSPTSSSATSAQPTKPTSSSPHASTAETSP